VDRQRTCSPGRLDEERREADYFYDREVTPRHMVLKIFGPEKVLGAATDLRSALNKVRKLIVEGTALPPDVSVRFEELQDDYRTARETFIERAGTDLRPKRRSLYPRAGT
jgi:hypothetical protein